MTEPTVQVPVSLIEDALNTSPSAVERRVNAVRALRALLSQPTPTAGRCADPWCNHQAHGGPHSWEKRPAASPSIADMAPGTTCGKDVAGTVPSWAGEDQVSPCPCVLLTGHNPPCRCSHEIDPSTICDVIPPKG